MPNLSPFNSTVVQLNITLSCASSNVVYCLLCSKENCHQIYIGQTKRQLKERFGEHKTLVRNNSKCTVAEHFNGPYSLDDMQMKVFTPKNLREERKAIHKQA